MDRALTLREALYRLDLSVPQLAEKVRLHPNTLYAAVCHGRCSERTAYKLAQYFGRQNLAVQVPKQERKTWTRRKAKARAQSARR
jgi:hypothetical protein